MIVDGMFCVGKDAVQFTKKVGTAKYVYKTCKPAEAAFNRKPEQRTIGL